jgi:hypothetical protein
MLTFFMRSIIFYKDKTGNSPVTNFLDSLAGKSARKVTWVLSLIEEIEIIPKTYLK